MECIKLGDIETHFAEIIWSREPLSTNELVKLCAEELSWKRTTTYTVLKKLCKKGIFKTENRLVTATISKQEFDSIRSKQFVEQVFDGSLLDFLVAFTSQRTLDNMEIYAIQNLLSQIIDKT